MPAVGLYISRNRADARQAHVRLGCRQVHPQVPHKSPKSTGLAFVDDVQTFSGDTRAADIIAAWSKAFREHPDPEKVRRSLETLTARFAPLAEAV